MADPLNIVVIHGTVRDGRRGLRAARFAVDGFGRRGHAVTLVDPLARNIPMMTRMYKEYAAGETPAWLEELAALYRRADAFIMVSGEYNLSIPPPLSNLIDYFLEEYSRRPSAILCYSAGPFGGVRAAMQLRVLLGEIGTVNIPTILAIPKIESALDEAGVPSGEPAALDAKFQEFAAELEWYARALRAARAADPA